MGNNNEVLKLLNDSITPWIENLVDRAENKRRTFIDRVIYPYYQKAQQKRWETENQSEGSAWSKLNSDYAFNKLRWFAGYPGAGRLMMVATGRLFTSVRGPGRGFVSDNSEGINQHVKIIGTNYMEVGTQVDYADEVAEVRPFMEFSDATIEQWVEKFRDWLDNGIDDSRT